MSERFALVTRLACLVPDIDTGGSPLDRTAPKTGRDPGLSNR